eukprot:TRINITY_DN3186_c0_g2_i1.p2 TRINITY_DN3186_c0_g2~~TRINITY_DN3186_c0_g2_i1.p2  ORF type:complete len:116 (+),score=5.08 TRINITY_DN3186_c0_g2_i1:804-1151(+)
MQSPREAVTVLIDNEKPRAAAADYAVFMATQRRRAARTASAANSTGAQLPPESRESHFHIDLGSHSTSVRRGNSAGTASRCNRTELMRRNRPAASALIAERTARSSLFGPSSHAA